MKIKIQISLLLSLFITTFSFAQIAATEQGFDDVENLPGWAFSNQSVPLGDSGWFQGNSNTPTSIMVAQEGEEIDSFIAANFRNTGGSTESSGVICNYLIMPNIGNIESLSFYTRSIRAANNFSIYPDRLHVLYSPTGEIEVGDCTNGFGDFTDSLLVINPDLTQENNFPEGYPLNTWEQFTLDINGDGRIAFVYYVEDAGEYGSNSNYIGIDSLEWVVATTDPQPIFSQGFE